MNHPDPDVVDAAAVLEVFGSNTAALRKVFETLRRDLPAYLKELDAAVATADCEAAALAAHRVAGAAGALGGVRVLSLARFVEQVAAERPPSSSERLSLATAAAELLDALDRWTASLLSRPL